MADIVQCVLVMVVCATLGVVAKLPSYIHPCPRADHNAFKECALKNAREAAPFLLPGDRKHRLQQLDPIKISELLVDQNGLKIKMMDVEMSGAAQATIKDVDVDFENRKFSYTLFIPQYVIQSNYEVNGMISILPITGNGRINVTLDNFEYTFTIAYDLVKKKDGKEYLSFKDSNMQYTLTRLYLFMTNLFNGDAFLGNQMNQFFDDNWRDLNREVGPSFAQAISLVIAQVLSSQLSTTPFDEIFPKE